MAAREHEWRPESPLETPVGLKFDPPRRIGVLAASWPSASVFFTACLVPYYLPLGIYDNFPESFVAPSWQLVAKTYAKNVVLGILWYGTMYHVLYVSRQSGPDGKDRKFHREWPRASDPKFLFGRQLYENIFMSLGSGMAFCTAYEVAMMCLIARGRLPMAYTSLSEMPVLSIVLLLATPWWSDFHFYWVHRLLHYKPLYRWCHALHHKNVSPIPWSGLSMHPAEHLIYFTAVLVHLVIPTHPLHVLFTTAMDSIGPVFGHTGFDGPLSLRSGLPLVQFSSYFHHLHHRYSDCNYGDPLAPMDVWFGTFYDGKAHSRGKGTLLEVPTVLAINALYLLPSCCYLMRLLLVA